GSACRWWEGSSADRAAPGGAPAPACASAPAASAPGGRRRWRWRGPAPSGRGARSSLRLPPSTSPPPPPPPGRPGRAASPPPGRCGPRPPPPRRRAAGSWAARWSGAAADQLLPEEVERGGPGVVPGVLLLEPVSLLQRQQVPDVLAAAPHRPDDLLRLALRDPWVVLPLLHEEGGADLVRRMER